jgi:hypothetical protein
MAINLKTFSRSFVRNLGPISPILLLVAAAAVYFASTSLQAAAGTVRIAQDKESRKVSLAKTQITTQQALAAAQKLSKLAPATKVAVAGPSVVVSIANPEQFAEWVHALNELQTSIRDVQWEVQEMCIASCESGEPAKAFVTAYRRQIKVD